MARKKKEAQPALLEDPKYLHCEGAAYTDPSEVKPMTGTEVQARAVQWPGNALCRELNGARKRKRAGECTSEGSRKYLERLEVLHAALGDHEHTEEM